MGSMCYGLLPAAACIMLWRELRQAGGKSACFVPTPPHNHRHAGLAGLISLTKTVAREYAGRGITANCVAPGFIHSGALALHHARSLGACLPGPAPACLPFWAAAVARRPCTAAVCQFMPLYLPLALLWAPPPSNPCSRPPPHSAADMTAAIDKKYEVRTAGSAPSRFARCAGPVSG